MIRYIVRNRVGRTVLSTDDDVLAEMWRKACHGTIEVVALELSWAQRHGQVAA